MQVAASLRVVVLAHEHMNLLDLAGPVQAFATASRQSRGAGPALYDIVVASVDGGAVTTGSGVEILTAPLAALDATPIDTILAPGGCKGADYFTPPRLVDWVRRRAPSVRRLCSVCTGAFLLAAAGQLDGRTAATHWEWADRLTALYPGVKVDPDKIFIQDGALWT
ncbi:MAG: AraC family transcriptional regulator, partial [Pseudomonadota bacterium]|nr:AraC family transcriptional regulator [Pseudomonadota bacterium]